MIFSVHVFLMGRNLYFQGYSLKAVVDVLKMSMDVRKIVKGFVNVIFNALILFH